MRFRVVCGFEVTIAIFCPTSRFTSVDFPAFGLPTIAANPERWSLFFSASSLIISCNLVLHESSGPGFSVLFFRFADENLGLKTYPASDSTRVYRRATQLLYFHAQHFSLIRFEHLKSKSFQIAFLARSRNFPADVAQQSCNRRATQLLYFHAQHFSLIRFEHLKSKSFQIAFLARSRNFPADVAQQSCNRRH